MMRKDHREEVVVRRGAVAGARLRDAACGRRAVMAVRDVERRQRIDFVGGARGMEGLERRVKSGEMAVAFSLYPTQMTDLMAVADAGLIMPPKSTWFEPKLADGMVNHVLD